MITTKIPPQIISPFLSVRTSIGMLVLEDNNGSVSIYLEKEEIVALVKILWRYLSSEVQSALQMENVKVGPQNEPQP